MSNVIVGSNDYISAMTGGVFSIEALARTVVGNNILQISPASILADYIIDTLGKMSDPSDEDVWPLYIASLPDGPQVSTNCGAIYDTSGIDDGRYMIGSVVQHYGVQLRIQSRDYNDAYVKIEDLSTSIDVITNVSIEIGALEFEMQNASKSSSITYIGPDGKSTKRRFNFTVNYLLTIRSLTTTVNLGDYGYAIYGAGKYGGSGS